MKYIIRDCKDGSIASAHIIYADAQRALRKLDHDYYLDHIPDTHFPSDEQRKIWRREDKLEDLLDKK